MNINTRQYIEKYIKIRDKAGKIIDYKDKDIIKIISKIYFYNWLLSE